MDEIFDDLCELAARAGRARAALITRLDKTAGTLEVLGRYGTVKTFEPEFELPLLDPVTKPIIAIRDVAREPAFVGHPISSFVPTIHSLIAAILSSHGSTERTTLKLLNPDTGIFDDLDAFACLSKLIMVYQQLMNYMELSDTSGTPFALHGRAPGFHDSAAADVGPAAKFLLDTLFHRLSLRSRSAATFVSLRTWRKSIKTHQIAAFAAVKQSPPPGFVNLVADEIVTAARHLYGVQTVKTVVPIPGGSSGLQESFSVLLAKQVAKKLDCPCVQALAGSQTEGGASHPKKSSRLKPYQVIEPVTGITLIVDDVVTSGRHFELAQTALRNSGATCFAVAWIGA
ncbi:MAG: hypothetical protein H7X89_12045 [Rhizobiales bacterium]|nr:hypothetical protein [Hyphomicrobiales bacterium]